jgi:hypothetical protein
VTSIERYTFDGCSSLTSIHIPEGLTSIDERAFGGCSSLTSVTIPEGVTSIGQWAFSGCSSLTSVTIPEGVTSIGQWAFGGCNHIPLRVYWYCDLPINVFSGESLQIFTKDGSIPEGATNYKNSVINGEADELDITDWNDNLDNITITAKKVSYTKKFADFYNNEWYTISLPFSPSQITHEEKGTIAPFNSDVEDAKNFWLRKLTLNGYQNVTEMEANHAYVIAMPTSRDYADEFTLDGNVTFSAENVTFTWDPIVSEGPTYSMYPTYEKVKKSMDVYAMNTDYYVNGYDYGLVFVRGAVDVEPYEAYVKPNDGTATMRSVLPMADGKRTAVRGVSSSGDASSRGSYGHRKPQIDDM